MAQTTRQRSAVVHERKPAQAAGKQKDLDSMVWRNDTGSLLSRLPDARRVPALLNASAATCDNHIHTVGNNEGLQESRRA